MIDHLIGQWGTQDGGPTLIAIGGMHGNEPAGVVAVQRVLAQLGESSIRPLGRFEVLMGNPHAIDVQRRFLDVDLNRSFRSDVLDGAPTVDEPREYEAARSLSRELRGIVEKAKGPVFAVDLHTTSSRSAPFVLFSDRLRNRAFAAPFQLPLILGLEEMIEGALLDHLDWLGVLGVGVEGGQHTASDSADNLESILWIALASSGVIERSAVPELESRLQRLRDLRDESPNVLEVRYRHATELAASFRMLDGFANLQPVRVGQLLAHEDGVPVRALESGRLLLPRYQSQGTDGFFIARSVSPLWLRISSGLRKMRVNRLLPLMPGVRTEPGRPRTLALDTRVARIFPLQVLHLLGYRRLKWTGPELIAGPRDP